MLTTFPDLLRIVTVSTKGILAIEELNLFLEVQLEEL